MRRLLTTTALLGLVAPGLVILPVATPTAGAGAPRPVPASIATIPLSLAQPAAGQRYSAGGLRGESTSMLLEPRATAQFSTVGVTWAHHAEASSARVSLRTRASGRWSAWQVMEAGDDDATDPGSRDTKAGVRRGGTEPLWVGPSDGVQVRLTASAVRLTDVRVELIDPGSAPADARVADLPRSVAVAGQGRPYIIRRSAWGADESVRGEAASYNDTVKVGFVHHTASSSSYSRAQAAAMLRGIYAYHVNSRGWSDIGYNMLVDKYGRVYEGRHGSIDADVFGAHTGGFNRNTFGIAMLGDFSVTAPPPATLASVERVLAWKLGEHHRDPLGKATLTSAGGGTSRYPSGQQVSFNSVAPHRDAGFTSCPGAPTVARLASIRSVTRRLLGAGFADIEQTGPEASYVTSREPVVVTARALGTVSWRLTVTGPSGETVHTASGRTAGQLRAAWDFTDARGSSVVPGTYDLRLTGSNGGDLATPWTSSVTVVGPLPDGVTVIGPDGTVGYVRDGRLLRPTPALLAATRPDQVLVRASAAQLAALPAAQAIAPQGLAGRDPVDGTVRVADGGTVLTLTAAAATALGYDGSVLPSLTAADFALPAGPSVLDGTRHVDGSLVFADGRTYLLAGGVRRLVDPTFVASYGIRPVLPLLPGDHRVVGAPAGPADGAVVRLTDGRVFTVKGGVRTEVPRPVADRLGLRASVVPTVSDALLTATAAGPALR